jgi:hypothetical protein
MLRTGHLKARIDIGRGATSNTADMTAMEPSLSCSDSRIAPRQPDFPAEQSSIAFTIITVN